MSFNNVPATTMENDRDIIPDQGKTTVRAEHVRSTGTKKFTKLHNLHGQILLSRTEQTVITRTESATCALSSEDGHRNL